MSKDRHILLFLQATHDIFAYLRIFLVSEGGLLKGLSALVMKNTGKEYKTALGDFSSALGDLRLLNVVAGTGGKFLLSHIIAVPSAQKSFTLFGMASSNIYHHEITDIFLSHLPHKVGCWLCGICSV